MEKNDFTSVKVGLASPARILEWSHGEVKKPETINYRSQKPEPDGLFSERVFGPTKDWECYCGKYKKVRYKGVVCDRCGVEVTKSSVRRERMGHIALAAPVAHIWYLRGTPSRMSLLLNVAPKSLEEVVYFVSWIITDPGSCEELAYKQVISEKEFRDYTAKYGPNSFVAETGAGAVKTLLEQVDLEKERKEVKEELEKATGDKRKKLIKRLETIEAFTDSDNQPEWMILDNIPVIPPDLRPMLQLDGGRFATSDLNDLYRRVITRNNRLKKLLELGTPTIIVQNEKRMLQEAVDALIDNGRRSKPVTGAGGRALKSLSHSLNGKQGRFRQNLLGKRVDFSGRSVIAVGPDLKMYQCGLPREMALQLFKPFVINEIVHRGLSSNQKAAEKLIDRLDPRIWDIVEYVISDHPVLLNRAPTLHRLGIQAFMPKLVDGRAIRLHPLVCPGFNADFDGDQMAVHVPLSEEACAEAKILMLASNNILGPKDGKPIVTPSQDMVLGNYYLTMEETAEEFNQQVEQYKALGDQISADIYTKYAQSEGRVYKDINEVRMAYDTKQTHLHSRIAIKANSLGKTSFTKKQESQYLLTTVGRVLFNDMFPKDFVYINEVDKPGECFKHTPDKYFVPLGTDIKAALAKLPISKAVTKSNLGDVIGAVFKKYANDEGNTYKIFDNIKDNGFKYSTVSGMSISLDDIKVSPNKAKYVEQGKAQALKINDYYDRGLLTLQEKDKELSELWDNIKNHLGDELMAALPRKNPIFMMADSGARGNKSHFTQLAGMRGLMGKPTQSKSTKEYQSTIIEVPIYSNFREGLNVSEFFISTHGVRKGLTDTALKTAESGYLTRRLVDVAQDVVITEEDCGTDKGYLVKDIVDRKDNTVIEHLFDRIVGRYSKQDVEDPKTGELIIASDEYITEPIANKIIDAGIKEMLIRNTFVCDSTYGVCAKCYGKMMATGKRVEVGEAVGIMAAQSIGEPGTQLTLRNFHTGGVAGNSDITQGLPRVEELFEARCPKHPALLAKISGEVTEVTPLEDNEGVKIVISNDKESIAHKADPTQIIRSWIKPGYQIEAGDKLTEGSVNPKELLEVAGVGAVQAYILKEVMKVYQSQGIAISDKHLEVMIRQMLRKVVILEGNDTGFSAGKAISLVQITEKNNEILQNGGKPAVFGPTLLGISKSSVETDSFLSAASFQETTKVLTDAAVKGKVDHLVGLKENVIIGHQIPAGTGFKGDRPSNLHIEAVANEMKRIKRERYEEENAANNREEKDFKNAVDSALNDQKAQTNEEHEAVVVSEEPVSTKSDE